MYTSDEKNVHSTSASFTLQFILPDPQPIDKANDNRVIHNNLELEPIIFRLTSGQIQTGKNTCDLHWYYTGTLVLIFKNRLVVSPDRSVWMSLKIYPVKIYAQEFEPFPIPHLFSEGSKV